MGDEDAISSKILDTGSQFRKHRGVHHHVVVYTSQAGNKVGDGTLGINQRMEFIHYLPTIVFIDSNFGDFISDNSISGGLYVYDAIQTGRYGPIKLQ